jgi:hypothetical protein
MCSECTEATNLECADIGGALDLFAFLGQWIQSGVALATAIQKWFSSNLLCGDLKVR